MSPATGVSKWFKALNNSYSVETAGYDDLQSSTESRESTSIEAIPES